MQNIYLIDLGHERNVSLQTRQTERKRLIRIKIFGTIYSLSPTLAY